MNAVAAGLVLLGLALVPQDAPARKAPRVPPTRLGVELLSNCPVVVVARTIATREAAIGTDLLRVRVLERMLGPDTRPGDELSVLSPAGQFLFGSEDLLFLRPYGEGGRFEVAERITITDKHYAAKLTITRRMIWLMEIADVEQRNDATLALLFDLLRSKDEWCRRHALDELAWMATARHSVFTASRRARLLTVGRVSPHEKVSRGVEIVARSLESEDARLREAAQKEQSGP
ncbi:MAG: hypothetical protein ACYTG2_04325 [Planctomycetota bacterium]|jgi:hypothetical protein